jgi:hypothetical protein
MGFGLWRKVLVVGDSVLSFFGIPLTSLSGHSRIGDEEVRIHAPITPDLIPRVHLGLPYTRAKSFASI